MPRLLLLVMLCLACLAPLQAQPPPFPSPDPSATPAVSPDPLLGTPRAALLRFLQAMQVASPLRPDLYPLAQLELSGYPAVVRGEKGIELCRQLNTILAAAEIDVNAVPEETSETLVRLYRQPGGHEVCLERQSDGRWLFPAETVASIEPMHTVLSEKGRIQRWEPPTWLRWSFLGLSGVQWLGVLGTLLASFLIGRLCSLGLRHMARRVLSGERLKVTIDEQKHVLRPLGFLVGSVAFWIVLPLLRLTPGVLVLLVSLTKLVAASAAVLSAYRLADLSALYLRWHTTRTDTTFDDMLVPLLRRTFKLVVFVLGVLFVAQNLEINVWSLFAGFSVLGAMVALAGQDLLKNFFGSLTVLVDRPFSVGDWIAVEGVEGVVEDLGFRSTRIRTFYDSLITLPNSRLITACVDNYGARRYRRYSKLLNVVLQTPPARLEAFCEGIRSLIRCHPYTRQDSFQVWVNDMSDHALQILLYVFWTAPDWATELQERHRLLVDIHRLAAELGVEFAYPTGHVHLQRGPAGPGPRADLTPADLEWARQEGRETAEALARKAHGLEGPPPGRG